MLVCGGCVSVRSEVCWCALMRLHIGVCNLMVVCVRVSVIWECTQLLVWWCVCECWWCEYNC